MSATYSQKVQEKITDIERKDKCKWGKMLTFEKSE